MLSKALRLSLFSLLLTFATSAFALDPAALKSVQSMKISREEIKQGLEMLKQNGLISLQDYENAIDELKTMSDQDIAKKKDQAVNAIKNNQGSFNKMLNDPSSKPEELKKMMETLEKQKQ